MRIHLLALAVLGSLAAGCSGQKEAGPTASLANANAQSSFHPVGRVGVQRVAALPDRGELVSYDRQARPIAKGAYTLYPVSISEAHALRAIAEGGMVVQAPDGHPIKLRSLRQVEHTDGNWTWVGREAGDAPGREAVLTFGEKAVYGTIPDGRGGDLAITTLAGRTWMVDVDPRKAAALEATMPDVPDFVSPEALENGQAGARRVAAAAMRPAAAPVVKAQGAAATASTTIDVVLGYSTTYAASLGGTSQAVTRLNYFVDIANQAYVDSKVDGAIRVVHTMEVDYPDNTSNQSALFDLTGVTCAQANDGAQRLPEFGLNCTATARPAALQPLADARERYGADLVSLVRTFQSGASGSCGVGWLLGAAQAGIDSSSAPFGYSVVADSNNGGATCREEYLAHELGHNMGLQHDRATAQGTDDTNGDGVLLDPEEYGVTSYSFGYSAGPAAGNFYTLMSLRRTGQTGYRIFSNPRIASCGGLPCGGATIADNARALGITMPLVAAFRQPVLPLGGKWLRGDFDGDGNADIFWRNNVTGANSIWRSGNSGTQIAVTSVSNMAWDVVGVGDFDGDGKSDLLWRNSVTGANAIWKSGSAATIQAVTSVTNLAWTVAGVGDFDHDGHADILWRNTSSGANVIWKSGSAATMQAVSSVSNLDWVVAGVGDFNADGSADIVWRNVVTGANTIWRSGNSGNQQAVTSVTNVAWNIAAVADFNGDGIADLLWRNQATGGDVIWKSGNAGTMQAVSSVTNLAWIIVGAGDFNHDGKADILWRNQSTGANGIWLGASSVLQQPISSVSNLSWMIAG